MDEWRCRRHPPLPGGGVCPHCLRDRLLRLCPDCACPRPCACSPSCASSPSSSSSGASALGRVHSLIEREHRVARSRSVAAHGAVGVGGDQRRPKSGVWGWVSFRKPLPPPAAAAGVQGRGAGVRRRGGIGEVEVGVNDSGGGSPGGQGGA
ncbi:unnamed protein product [Miscanthus lutarioriparius]|uniref:Uncharacterized protein n=1 Tax=Miscanthus lutarioriparius TaxID=422564 RepID=A0A811R0I5_9POAL|nr:unnamed protein product [Miscanthus lutarioriparius]